MIRRPLEPNRWLLISQVAHARLSGVLAREWCVPGRWRELWPLVVEATAHHDDGWEQWEQHPQPDPETGAPLNFTEMPMEVSTRLWARSVHAAAEAAGKAAAENGGTAAYPTEEECGAEGAEATDTPVSPEVWSRLRSLRRDPAVGAALGAMWVSRHFCWLAEQALQHRRDPRDRVAAAEFLRSQRVLQSNWTAELARALGDADVPRRLAAEGFRWVQLFDRISLWLCLEPADATEAEFFDPWDRTYAARFDEELAGTKAADGGERRITWRPFPFEASAVVCEVFGRAVARRPYADAEDLAEELQRGDPVVLRWRLIGG